MTVEVSRHTAAHVLAQAVKRLYGEQNVKLGIGPVIQDGFYYDMELPKTLTPSDLAEIDAEMRSIVKENLPIKRRVFSREEAIAFFANRKESFKLELIADLPEEEELTVYEQGEFADLCRGPHLASTAELPEAFKLTSVAGAYWRGDCSRPMLQRIYGALFASQEELDAYLLQQEEARERDHRKLGRELGLFMFSEEAPGMPFYLPKGTILRGQLEQFSRELQTERDYDEVRTPFLMNQRMWEQSGHWDHYRDNMYFTDVDDVKFALKPMNCPGHMLIYKNGLHSYRELPIRLCEFGQVHRHELSGALNGMMRVRTFCQDDAHLFVRPDQIEDEIGKVIDLIDRIYRVFGFTYTMELSTRPDDSMGSPELWEKAEAALANVLHHRGSEYRVNAGDGAFYGPKIDFHIRDAIGRSWQCATIQLDFQMPEKFDLHYIGEDGGKHRPVVIHRAVYGSIDRFMGILVEHYGGQFPLWLAPVQTKLIPVTPKNLDYALEVKQQLAQAGIRAEVDARDEKLGRRIREAGTEKVPYILVLGDKEQESRTASVRKRGEGDQGIRSVSDLAAALIEEIKAKE
ncbi:threonine--tRNA ligase [Gorillibacterium timonense]|uniref:threonine--tRNA ligase n=1 Tax=Gorillibacterium timonense TaxID=1689269 RepID=UPI000B30996E|nr:threonine--tRNA ligase [Gorillibacterium timonense]